MPDDETTPSPPPQSQKRQQGAQAILLSLLMLAVAGYIMTDKVGCWRRGEKPVRSICAANLRQCGKALALYADYSGGHLPADIDILVTQRVVHPGELVCPGSRPVDYDSVIGVYSFGQPISQRLHELMHSCYVYIPGQKAPADPADVLMYEKNGCHPKDGGNVLFGDYHAEWVEPYSKVEELVAKTEQRLATPIPSPEERP